MGLYLQRYQEVPSELKFRTSGSLSSHHDCAVHGRIRAIIDPDMS